MYARVEAYLEWILSQGVTNVCDREESEKPEKPEVPERPELPNPKDCNLAWVGDGICDARNNHAGCFFDGNDCCKGKEWNDQNRNFCHVSFLQQHRKLEYAMA